MTKIAFLILLTGSASSTWRCCPWSLWRRCCAGHSTSSSPIPQRRRGTGWPQRWIGDGECHQGAVGAISEKHRRTNGMYSEFFQTSLNNTVRIKEQTFSSKNPQT